MTQDDPFATETMAGIFEKQGHIEKAIGVYRTLLSEDPGRGDIAERLAALESRRHRPPKENLVGLISEWLALEIRFRDLERLSRLKKS
ncbi:MAG: hypothetical protein PVH30_04870 [Desulfobacterales bacterium]|jgi:hypothetical protein